jgi:5-methylcytosine-specific restriction enzyme subunit McrC
VSDASGADGGNLADVFARFLGHGFLQLARRGPKLLALLRLCLTWLDAVPERPLQESALRGIQIHLGLREYGWMLDACRLLARWALPEPSGILRFQEVLEDEEEMRRLFEEFVRGFYKLEQDEYRVTASPLSWRWEPLDEASRALLPGMRTDVLLSRGDERIVIDTKYTPRAVTEESGYYGGTLQSGHLYQMHAYLSTLAGEGAHPLRGILLYPRVDREVRATYEHSDYTFEVRTVDLGAPWRQIHEELLLLVEMAGTTAHPAALNRAG